MAAAPLSDDGPSGHDWQILEGNTWECSKCFARKWSRPLPDVGETIMGLDCEERQVASVANS